MISGLLIFIIWLDNWTQPLYQFIMTIHIDLCDRIHPVKHTHGVLMMCFSAIVSFSAVGLSDPFTIFYTWWRHQMETFSALLGICAGNSPVTGEFPAQRPMTQSFDVLFDLHLNKRLIKQSWGWWFETRSCPLWRHCNGHPYPPLSGREVTLKYMDKWFNI